MSASAASPIPAAASPAPASAASSVPVEELRRQLNELAEQIKAHKKALKAANKNDKEDAQLKELVARLQGLKTAIATAESGDPAEVARLAAAKAAKEREMAWRRELEAVITHRGFFFPSNEIHPNTPAGFFDFGPVGCAIKANLVALWKQWFILYDQLLEIETPTMTPEAVFKTSGHVDRFTDLMVDAKNEDLPYRADKLLEAYCEKRLEEALAPAVKADLERIERDAGAMNADQMQEVIEKYEVRSPQGNELSKPYPFNLMFVSSIGPSGKNVGYLRPETAQGMFVNFKKLLDFNSGKMPFGAAQVGPAFRNEIAPRNALLRVREFMLAEIEFFVHPEDKRHANFKEIADLHLLLLPREAQEKGQMTAQKIVARDAVAEGVINNETLAYFMARTQLFLLACGIKEEKLRFRQHKATEMAHYARECWDAEVLTSYGWIECVGHADRAAYDLDVHSKATGADLTAQETFAKPREVKVAKWDMKNALMGKTFGKKNGELQAHLKGLKLEQALAIEAQLAAAGSATVKLCSGEEFTLTRAMLSVSEKIDIQHTAKYTPHVIEPAFGIGRIFYAVLEHTFYVRPEAAASPSAASAASSSKDKEKDKGEKATRAVFALPPVLAPQKLTILPLTSNPEFAETQRTLLRAAVQANLSAKVDASSNSIGRRYARADEIGVPFGLTLDEKTAVDGTVTLRERDSMQQVRIHKDEVIAVVAQLSSAHITWQQVYDKYPKFVYAASE